MTATYRLGAPLRYANVSVLEDHNDPGAALQVEGVVDLPVVLTLDAVLTDRRRHGHRRQAYLGAHRLKDGNQSVAVYVPDQACGDNLPVGGFQMRNPGRFAWPPWRREKGVRPSGKPMTL